MPRTRREVIGIGAAALGTGALGGCLSGSSAQGAPDSPAQASFFVLQDFASEIAGENLAVESVVPFGQHGHGWEPSGQVQRDIYDAPLFAYVGEGFQPWADDVVANLRADDADVEIVEAWHGVDLLEFEETHDHEEAESHDGADHGDESHHEAAGPDEDGDHDVDTHEESHDREQHGDDHDEGHDHGDGRHDPHFWLDPTRATVAVDNLAAGLETIDPDNGDAYRDRAADYAADLADLDEQFQSRLAGAPRETVLVAGHNAFRYLGRRYGFGVHSLSGLSPDEEPSASARREAASVVDEHDLAYVLTPALESTRAAEQLVAATAATDYLEIAALSGLQDDWREDGWGYLEIMRNVNLPTLERALGVE